EPVLQRSEIARAEVGVDIAEVASSLLHELSSVQVAERVGREVAESAEAPVNVLQAATRIVGRRQPERGTESIVPRTGHVRGLQVAAHERLLHLEAQHNVQVVRRLVCLDANERGAHIVDREDPVVERYVTQRIVKHLASTREEMLPERPTSTDLIFPQ